MLKRLEKRETFRCAREIQTRVHEVKKAVREIRPVSSHKLVIAGFAIMHNVIHSNAQLMTRHGQRRVARALLAAQAAAAILRRLRDVREHVALVEAAHDAVQREIQLLEQELLP